MRKLRSDITREGLARTPHRAFMRAMGLDDAAIQKPMIGVVSMKGEQTPCNMTHGFQVEAAKEGITEVGGPLALVRDGDIVRIDAAGRRMDLLLDNAEIAARRAAWRPLAPRHKAGLLAKYAAHVGQANKGAVTHAGAAEWPWFDR